MAMIQLPSDFKEFLKLLNTHEIQYLIIGGYAVGYHGYPRATGDLDIWVGVNPLNSGRIVAALKEFGFDFPDVTTKLFQEENKIVRMGMPPVRIELITTIPGVEFEECYAARVVNEIAGVEVSLIDLPNLKINKRASGRYKDLNDLENLP